MTLPSSPSRTAATNSAVLDTGSATASTTPQTSSATSSTDSTEALRDAAKSDRRAESLGDFADGVRDQRISCVGKLKFIQKVLLERFIYQ